jgi:hypothetical protein
MGEPKAFASLSSGLLARKGAARPAMRPQGFGQAGSGLEDLGWNDMGFEPPKPAGGEADETHDAFGAEIMPHPIRNPLAGLSPVGSPVHEQQAEIQGRLADCTDEGEDEDETAEFYEPTDEELAAVAPRDEEDDTADDFPEDDFGADVETPSAIVERASDFVPPLLAKRPVVFEPAAFEPKAAELVEEVATTVAEVQFAAPTVVPRRAPKGRAVVGSKAKAAFTLRLDKDRHLKLRLACAVSGQSAQLLVTDALDAWLAAMPELDAMAGAAPVTKG